MPNVRRSKTFAGREKLEGEPNREGYVYADDGVR